MSKFIIECPVCHRYAEAKTGFFARKKIDCTCGHVINVKTDRMTSRACPSCGNMVVYDQAEGKDAKCPVCRAQLVTDASLNNLVHFRCATCGCNLQADKSAQFITCPVCETEQNVQAQIKLEQERSNGIPSVIQYEGDNKTFVWKHPNTDFVTGSQLIVHESQEAIFFRNGEALDSFGAGRYTLETGVLPKMSSLLPIPVQGQPFAAEVYFVNLTTQMGIKWGTNSKVGLFDPATGIHVELGASGSFNLKVIDSRKLLLTIVGTTQGLTRDQVYGGDMSYFRTLVMTKVKANLARVIKESHISVLELDERIEQISHALKVAVNPDLAEYGLFMPEFYVANILTPDDDPNFLRMKQQHADQYLRVREEQIRKAEAEVAFERKAVEAQTDARMKIISAQGEADVIRLKAQAEAEAYRMQAEAEAQEMRMKGYTYQQETARQVSIEAMRNAGGSMAGSIGGIAGDMMQLGVGLGTVGSVIGMTREAINPVVQQASSIAGWTCYCGQQGITSAFCTNCGNKKPEPKNGWNCACGQKDISSNFCPNCGSRKPEVQVGWACTCGQSNITSNFCPNCGSKRPAAPVTWTCICGEKNITSNFCPNCGHKKEG